MSISIDPFISNATASLSSLTHPYCSCRLFPSLTNMSDPLSAEHPVTIHCGEMAEPSEIA
jgi:hypothetical protein